MTEEGGLASEKVIIVTEEILPREVIVSDPNRVLLPSSKVVAVIQESCGAHPSPVQGYYGRDHEFYEQYHVESRTREGFERWLEEWVLGVENRCGYLVRLREDRLNQLKSSQRLMAAPVDYGY